MSQLPKVITAQATMAQYTNKFLYVSQILVPFLKRNGSKRISQNLFDYYKRFSILKPDCDEIIISEMTEGGVTLAISAAVIRDDKELMFSFTATERDYRRKGYGSAVLQTKLLELARRKLTLSTLIAEDNDAAMALCISQNMKEKSRQKRMRSTGFYEAVLMVKE